MRRLTIILIILVTLLAAVSCSVKEDRGLCPCWLQIDLLGCIHFGPEVHIKGWSGNRNVMGAKVFEEDFDTIYEAEVPRGSVSYCAYSGFEKSRQSGMEVIIPEGEQSDRIYAYRVDVITLGETAYDKVHLHKQYANVFMSFAATEGMHIPGISVEIRSHWNGINLKDLLEKTRARDPLQRLHLTPRYENALTPLNEIKLTPTEKTLQGIFL